MPFIAVNPIHTIVADEGGRPVRVVIAPGEPVSDALAENLPADAVRVADDEPDAEDISYSGLAQDLSIENASRLQVLSDTLDQQAEEQATRTAELDALAEELSARADELSGREAAVGTREVELDRRAVSLDEQEEELAAGKRHLEADQRELAVRSDALDARSAILDERERSTSPREAQPARGKKGAAAAPADQAQG